MATDESAAPQSNSLGIPTAEFMDDVTKFMSQETNQENIEVVLRRLDEQHSKYKFMEISLVRKKRVLQRQIPEIQASLDMLELLKRKKDADASLSTHFLVNDQLFAKATIPPSDKVCLWLGANVMLEYTLDEAMALLSKNMAMAMKNRTQIEDDMDFLKDQLTTTEVNMARVYNWDVKRKQAARGASGNTASAT